MALRRRRRGRSSRSPSPADQWVWVNDPELAIAILKLPFDKIGVGPLIEGFEESGGIGNALTANYSPTWRPRRVLLQRPLSYRNVRGFGDIFDRAGHGSSPAGTTATRSTSRPRCRS